MNRVATLAAVVAVALTMTVAAAGDGGRSDLKNFQHVWVVMMENTGYDALIGNPNAPWINQAARTYGLSTNSYGVAHPSQPNYVANTSGSTNGVLNDNDITISVPNIVDQLAGAGKTAGTSSTNASTTRSSPTPTSSRARRGWRTSST
jgi:transcriptional regulator of nitric oxide reductase